MKVYYGRRTEQGCAVDVEDDGERCSLWGYSGSGSTQLAIALAADVLGSDERAKEVCHGLKSRLVDQLPHDGWVLTENQIRSVIDDIRLERGRPR